MKGPREHMQILRRRLNFLTERAKKSPVDLSYDKAEKAALDWAISVLEADGWYRCEECDITQHISRLKDGCPKCGQTMVPTTEGSKDAPTTTDGHHQRDMESR